MATAMQISRRFCEHAVVPLLRQRHPQVVDRLAVVIAGTGSDVLGLDDEISRDHHWGPRAAVLLPDDVATAAEDVRRTLDQEMASDFEGHPVHVDRANRTAVCVDGFATFLEWFLGTARLPARDEDWFDLCETDLLHVTAGEVVYDPSGEWSAIRRQLSYYPERVWHKRIADWCMYVTGRDAPYNLHRVSRRHDDVAAHIYFGQALRRTMELGFALERRYAPYPKWQYRLFGTLGGCGPLVRPILDDLIANTGWRARVDGLIRINHIYAEKLHELGLTAPPVFQPFDESLTDLTLYDTVREIYAKLPPAWLEVSFNQVESWEKLARRVLFDTHDYVQQKFGTGGKA